MILRFKKKAGATGYAKQLEIDTTEKTFKSGYFIFSGTAAELKSKDFEQLQKDLAENEFKKII